MEKGCRIVKLTEASLGRVLQHVQGKKSVKSWGVVTAYRYGNTPAENKELNKRLIDFNEIPELIVKNFYEYYNISIQ